MQNADEKTCFLLDEFGSGTEPAGRGAVEKVYWKKLIRKNSFGLVATHYLNLKNMAFSFSKSSMLPCFSDHKNTDTSYRL
jgi:DNA mismatch repair protein MutS2